MTPRTVRSSRDGAPWIWNVAAEQFPDAIAIYHAKQHLCDVAKAIYGPGTDLSDRWARDRRAELDAGRLCAVVAALRIHVETTPEGESAFTMCQEPTPHALSAVPGQGPVHIGSR